MNCLIHSNVTKNKTNKKKKTVSFVQFCKSLNLASFSRLSGQMKQRWCLYLKDLTLYIFHKSYFVKISMNAIHHLNL